LRPLIGNRIYGCDDCLAVCPWNKFARAGGEAKLAGRDDLAAPPLAELAALDDAAFPHASPADDQAHRPRPFSAQRDDRDRQLSDRSLIAAAQKGLRRTRRWSGDGGVAFGRLAAPTAVKATALRFAPEERDAAVLEEWKIALAVPAEA